MPSRSQFEHDIACARRQPRRHASSLGQYPFLVGRFTLLLVVTSLALSGCSTLKDWAHNGFKVGPEYCRPAAPVSDAWIESYDEKVRSELPPQPMWWEVLNDPILNELVQTVHEQNLSLRAAGMRVLNACAQRGIAVGGLFPQQQRGTGQYQRTRLSVTTNGLGQLIGRGFPINREFGTWSTGVDLSWELDIWGKFRRAIESADANLDASIEDYDAILVSLIAETAATYVEYRTFQEQLAYAKSNVEIQKGSLGIAVAQFEGGRVSELDVTQARATLKNTEQLVPLFEAQMRDANNRLCVLLGIPVRDLAFELSEGLLLFAAGTPTQEQVRKLDAAEVPDALQQQFTEHGKRLAEPLNAEVIAEGSQWRIQGQSGTFVLRYEEGVLNVYIRIPAAPPEVAVGIPADLLRRRPDVRSAERLVAAQCALIGVAAADLFPHFSITGVLSLDSQRFKDLFANASSGGVIAPGFSWDILNYGRLISRIRAEEALFQNLAYQYQQSVLIANREAETAINSFLRAQERLIASREAVDASRRSVEIVTTQYREGATDFNRVFNLQLLLVQDQDRYATAQGDVALALIGIYRALGGGWEIRSGYMPAIEVVPGPPTPELPPVPDDLDVPAAPEDAPALIPLT